MVQMYTVISSVAFGLAMLFAAVAVVCWVRFHVWRVLGELSGKTAKKSVADLCKKNVETEKWIETSGTASFQMLQDIVLIHTDERI